MERHRCRRAAGISANEMAPPDPGEPISTLSGHVFSDPEHRFVGAHGGRSLRRVA